MKLWVNCRESFCVVLSLSVAATFATISRPSVPSGCKRASQPIQSIPLTFAPLFVKAKHAAAWAIHFLGFLRGTLRQRLEPKCLRAFRTI